jgi:hypothetical protein
MAARRACIASRAAVACRIGMCRPTRQNGGVRLDSYRIYLLGAILHQPDWQKKALAILDHVLEAGFIATETGLIRGYRETTTGKICMNYKHNFLTEGVDWNDHVGQQHHIDQAKYAAIRYTEPFLNNQHIVAPTVFYLKHLAKVTSGDQGPICW